MEKETAINESQYLNGVYEIANNLIHKFTIILLVINLIWGGVFVYFIHNSLYSTTDSYYIRQEQPDQSQFIDYGDDYGDTGNTDNENAGEEEKG